MSSPQVVIIGGGVAGLVCARHLHEQGVSSLILEASEAVGGRIRTDLVDGFSLDRGFQILLTAYPEARKLLDFEALNLRTYEPGSLIRYRGEFYPLVDPVRRPGKLLSTLTSPIATFADKFRLARLKIKSCRGPIQDIRSISHCQLTSLSIVFLDPFLEEFF